MATTVTLSTFVQTPTKVIKHLDDGDVILTRRDGENLRLTVDDRAARQASAIEHATEVITHLARAASGLGADTLRTVFPWAEILTPEEREQFAVEYLTTLRAAASLHSFAVLDSVENAWRATAELKADPELQARIRERLESAEPVRASQPSRRHKKQAPAH